MLLELNRAGQSDGHPVGAPRVDRDRDHADPEVRLGLPEQRPEGEFAVRAKRYD